MLSHWWLDNQQSQLDLNFNTTIYIYALKNLNNSSGKFNQGWGLSKKKSLFLTLILTIQQLLRAYNKMMHLPSQKLCIHVNARDPYISWFQHKIADAMVTHNKQKQNISLIGSKCPLKRLIAAI